MAAPDKVVLVDGSSFIFRAYYAIPGNFRTGAGLPTNAIYGFATMFKKLFAGRKPTYGAVVFDAPGKTFREELYPDYKAQRPAMPEDLAAQLPWIDKLVEANNFPLLRKEGFEADDIIGTLTRQARDEGMEVLIVSGDKDFAQLIDDHVKMIDTLRDITFDSELVRKKWGVRPAQIVDLLAIMGDKVDNIPGVPGVGAKGAATLLERYGSLDGIIAHADELKGRQHAGFTEHVELAKVSRELATIDCSVPLEVGVRDLTVEPPAQAALNGIYKELEFYSLLGREQLEHTAAESAGDYQTLTELGQVDELLATLDAGSTPVAVEAVHDSPSPIRGQLVGLAFCAEPGVTRYVPLTGVGGLGRDAIERLRTWFEGPKTRLVTHDAKALWNLLARSGIGPARVVGDTLLASFLIDPTKLIPQYHRLEAITKEYLQRTLPPVKGLVGSGRDQLEMSEVGAAETGTWIGHRVDSIREVWPLLAASLEEISLTSYLTDVDLPLSRVLSDMERTGIAVDPGDLAALGEEFHQQLLTSEARIHELAGREFNVGSTKQLSSVLFDELELPVIKRTKSGYSTNSEVLERLREHHPIAGEILEWRRLAKLINTYTDVLQREVDPATGRVHATFQQTVGATGRLITTNPDLQRTPIKTPEGKRIRRAFVTHEGWQILSADWSQIELRILAHFSNDPALIEAFQQGLDIHRRTGGQLFGVAPEDVDATQRNIAKTVNFATIYGQGATSLGQILGIPRKEAKRYIDGYFEAYAGVREWLDRTIALGHERGYVETLLHRRRYIPELSSNSKMERMAGERIAANTPIQGTGADICKLAMIQVHRDLGADGLQAKMLLQIHDELVFEAPAAEVARLTEIVRKRMETAVALEVPLTVDIGVGKSWADAH